MEKYHKSKHYGIIPYIVEEVGNERKYSNKKAKYTKKPKNLGV